MKLYTQLAGLALAVATTLMTSSCGGSSKASASASASATTESAQLTRAGLIAKADAICARINARRHLNGTLRSPHEYARVVPQLGAYEQAAAAELDKLTPPASMTYDWKRIANAIHLVADDTAKVGQDYAFNKISVGTTLLLRATNTYRQLEMYAKRAGFIDCAQP